MSRAHAPDSSGPADSERGVPVELPPKRRVQAAVVRYGERVVVERAVSLIAGNNEGEDFLLYVGGEHAQGVLDGAPALYWPELWGLRTLLYVWDASAEPSVVGALRNPAWRVREMAARIVLTRELPVAEELRELLTDHTARVRIAAARALAVVGSVDDVESLKSLLRDPEVDVRRAAQQSIDKLRGAKRA